MGLGIAFVASTRARTPVLIYDKSKAQLENSLALMDQLLARNVQKGKMQESDAKDARARITVVEQIGDFRDADMCIEVQCILSIFKLSTESHYMILQAVSESLPLKQSLFSSLAEQLRPDAILASNTSSISITKIAAASIPSGIAPSSAEGLHSASRVVGEHLYY